MARLRRAASAGAEAKPIWLDAGADTQRKTIVPSKWYDITQTDAGEKLTLKGTIYNTLAICRIVLNQIDELKIVEQQGVTGIHYDHEARAYLVQPGQMERAMLCCAALEALAEKDFALVFQENEKTALPDTPANEVIANVQRISCACILAFCRRRCVYASRRHLAQIKWKTCCERYPRRRASQHKK